MIWFRGYEALCIITSQKGFQTHLSDFLLLFLFRITQQRCNLIEVMAL